MERIRAIEREYRVAPVAAEDLGERLRADPSALDAEELEFADYRNFREDLEATYLIRLFAEFEAGLREAWELAFRRITVPSVRDLIDSIHAQRLLPDLWRDCMHDIRIYRNVLAHEGGMRPSPSACARHAAAYVVSSAACPVIGDRLFR